MGVGVGVRVGIEVGVGVGVGKEVGYEVGVGVLETHSAGILACVLTLADSPPEKEACTV